MAEEKKPQNQAGSPAGITRKRALQFVILLGVVSLLSDVTYEAARSINGPYLAILGASATAVGFIAGLGELIGYSLRLVSGYISDKTRQYWLITIIGYTVNLLAVPMMALAGYWEIAAGLIILERLGKSIRTPARDVMLSHAGTQIGSGWVFGLHEAMDQIGATAGPLVVTAMLYFKGSYKAAYAVLAIPAALAILSLLTARMLYPRPDELSGAFKKVQPQGMRRAFWMYMAAVAFIAAGYADFPLIAFHLKKTAAVNQNLIPLFYAAAMLVDAGAALVFGRLFDKIGLFVIMVGVTFSLLFAPLVFLGNWLFALAGMILWGIGMGMQESVLRAAIANMVAVEKRGSAYGIFNMGYGFSWFIGSALMGILYDISVYYLVVFSVAVQLVSIFFLYRAKKIETSV
jgi:MFS family permease